MENTISTKEVNISGQQFNFGSITCNRTACQSTNSKTWYYNKTMRACYCEACAKAINKNGTVEIAGIQEYLCLPIKETDVPFINCQFKTAYLREGNNSTSSKNPKTSKENIPLGAINCFQGDAFYVGRKLDKIAYIVGVDKNGYAFFAKTKEEAVKAPFSAIWTYNNLTNYAKYLKV